MREGGAGLFRIAVKDATAIDRKVEPLVRIERDGVRALDAAEQRPGWFREDRKPAVARVDVHPEAEALRNFMDSRERIERAGVHGPGIRRHKEGKVTGREIRGDLRNEIVDSNPEAFINRNAADSFAAQTEKRGGFRDGVMRLHRRVE